MVRSLKASPGLIAPFPWFGGKSRAAPLIWRGLGDVGNLVIPFSGSLAELLARPSAPGIETANERDPYVANFWRAIQNDAATVARFADWPVSEIDLHARHRWLRAQDDWRQRMRTDPEYFDPKIAGWWVWGIGQWIGDGWCHRGVNWRQLPSNTPMGVHARDRDLQVWFAELQARLRGVRWICGDWTRVLTPTFTTQRKCITAVILDPPYRHELRDPELYGFEADRLLNDRVWAWAVDHGNDPRMRIVLCGMAGEYTLPDDWQCVAWKGRAGYGRNGNRHLERLWFSPHCLPVA